MPDADGLVHEFVGGDEGCNAPEYREGEADQQRFFFGCQRGVAEEKEGNPTENKSAEELRAEDQTHRRNFVVVIFQQVGDGQLQDRARHKIDDHVKEHACSDSPHPPEDTARGMWRGIFLYAFFFEHVADHGGKNSKADEPHQDSLQGFVAVSYIKDERFDEDVGTADGEGDDHQGEHAPEAGNGC